ncbi:MAG: UDP-N-acetylmuramoyl-L-alanyl-D-glutamate--2,6-diaminopimelate ligase [Christensenellales bacterium]
MKLKELCSDNMRIIGNEEVSVKRLTYDSRKGCEGALFFCISGFNTDGHKYANDAVNKGAAALMVTRRLDVDVPQIIVEDARASMAYISREFYGRPDEQMRMVGITGTKGKTTTTYMVKSILEQSGIKTGLIGTIVNMIGNKQLYTERTTPESPDLFALLRRMADEGCKSAVMEVSSHSLCLSRAAGITFDVAVFTNLSRDHLDFHKTVQNYAESKKRLFLSAKRGVVNADDCTAGFIMDGIDINWRTVGIKENADLTAKNIEITPRGTSFDLCGAQMMLPVSLKIPGIFSVYNALCSAAVCLLLGEKAETIKKGLETLPGVAGRFEVLDTGGNPFTVILDYAHTPDSLESTLLTVRTFARGRIITVFGCGGDRDSGKRPIMGDIAGRLSDYCVITSDNPRTEEPLDIIKQIEDGIKDKQRDYVCIENRRKAIKHALQSAQNGDVIVLAGKGHETYQEIKGVKHPFDEKIVVAEVLGLRHD